MANNFRFKEDGQEVEAYQSDGTDEVAKRITHWIHQNNGRADFFCKGTVDYDLHQAFVRVQRDGEDAEMLRRGFWAVMPTTGRFYVVIGQDFEELYEKI